jgi:hypothetical protein
MMGASVLFIPKATRSVVIAYETFSVSVNSAP